MSTPPALRELLLQITGPEQDALWDYAATHGHGVEIFDLSDPNLLDDPAAVRARVAWYHAHRRDITGTITLHGAYQNLRPGAADSKIRAASRDRILQGLDLAEDLGARHVVFHSDFDLNPTPSYVAAWVGRATEFWRGVLAGRTIEVLLENAFEPDPQLVRALVEGVGLAQMGICFDVGHAHLMSALWARARGEATWPSPAAWLETLAPHLRGLHLSDNNGAWDQHAPLGTGTIPWADLLARLATPLPAVIEVAGVAGVRETEDYLASLTA